MINTHVELSGSGLENPVMPASRTSGSRGMPAAKKSDLNDLRAIAIKTITPHTTTGNPRPQIAVLKTGVLNSAGLTNPGVDVVIEDKLKPPRQSYPDLPIMASAGGEGEAGYVEVARKLSDSDLVNTLEIDISRPNINQGGVSSGVHLSVVRSLVKKIKAVTSVPIYLKLVPNVIDTIQISKATEKGGAGGLSLTNTLLGTNIDIKTRKPVLSHNIGGLSGEIAKLVALRTVHQARQSTSSSIIGMDGINSAQGVIRFILAGTNAVAAGTAHFEDSIASKYIADELLNELEKLGVEDINDLANQAEFNQTA